MVLLGMTQDKVHDAADTGSGRHLDSRPELALDALRIHFFHIIFLEESIFVRAGDRRIDQDDILQGLWHGPFEDAFQGIPVFIELEVLH